MSNDITIALVADVTAGILVLRSRDGVAISTGQAMERARNIVAGLLGNYEIRKLRDNQGDKHGRDQ